MPRYSDAAQLYAPLALSPYRWRYTPGDEGYIPGTGGPDVGTGAQGSRIESLKWPRLSLHALTHNGLDAANAIQAIRPGGYTARLDLAGEAWVLTFNAGAITTRASGQLANVQWTLVVTGQTATPSAGARAIASWAEAQFSMKRNGEPAPESLWVELEDQQAITAQIDPGGVFGAFAQTTATLVARWRPGALAGRVLRWRGEVWTIVNVEETERRRRIRLDVARTAIA